MNTESIEKTAYNEGFSAYMNGTPRYLNPYPQFSTARAYWFKGYDAAKDEFGGA